MILLFNTSSDSTKLRGYEENNENLEYDDDNETWLAQNMEGVILEGLVPRKSKQSKIAN